MRHPMRQRALRDNLVLVPLVLLALVLALSARAGVRAAPNEGAGQPESVAVRAWHHSAFGRLVFEWPQPIEVERKERGDWLVLRFARPLTAEFGAAARRLSTYLDGLVAGTDPREVMLKLTPGAQAEVETYEGRKVVVHLTGGSAAETRVGLRSGQHQGFARMAFDWPASVGFRVSRAEQRLIIAFDRVGTIDPVDLLALSARLAPWLDDASTTNRDGATRVTLNLKPGITARAFKIGAQRVIIDLLDPSERPPGEAVVAVPPPDTEAALPREGAGAPTGGTGGPVPVLKPSRSPPAPRAVPRVGVTLASRPWADAVALEFAWRQPVGATIMVRAGHLWAVFGAELAPSADPLSLTLAPELADYLGPGDLVVAENGMAVRFPLRRPVVPRVERDANLWRVILLPEAPPPQPVGARRLGTPPRLQFAASGSDHVVRLIDPEVGDQLEFWPLLAPGVGLAKARLLVDFQLLPTAQGLAWRPLSDRFQMQRIDDAIEFGGPEGLRLSEPPAVRPKAEQDREDDQLGASTPIETARSAAPSPPNREPPPEDLAPTATATADVPMQRPSMPRPPSVANSAKPLNLRAWSLTAEQTLPRRRAMLRHRIIGAAPADVAAARLDLARLLLAQGLADEALTMLSMITAPDLEAGPRSTLLAKQTLAAAAALLLGRLDEAAGLRAAALDQDREVALWRSALAAAEQDWPTSVSELLRSEPTLSTYSPRLQLRLGLPAFQAAIEVDHADLITLMLGRLAALDLSRHELAKVRFAEGLVQAHLGDVAGAERIWRDLTDDPHPETRVDATYARLMLLLEAGQITPGAALAELELAMAFWRGHPAEATMLDGLARLQQQNGDGPSAVRTWQAVLARFPEPSAIAQIAPLMRQTFRSTLLGEDRSNQSPVRALALYRDFPGLVPAGEPGDRVKRGLAEQLAAIDLLQPADMILERLIKGRFQGAAKADAGAKLADLRLRRPEATAALDALAQSHVGGGVPAELRAHRRWLQATALAKRGRPRDALGVLERDPSRAAQHLRADILWQSHDWPRFIASAEQMLADRVGTEAPLTKAEQELVIKLAVAHVQRGEVQELARLRARFGPKMQGEAGEAAFLMATLISKPAAEPDALLTEAADHLAQIRAFRAATPAN